MMQHKRTQLIVALVLVLTLVAAACSSGGDDAGDSAIEDRDADVSDDGLFPSEDEEPLPDTSTSGRDAETDFTDEAPAEQEALAEEAPAEQEASGDSALGGVAPPTAATEADAEGLFAPQPIEPPIDQRLDDNFFEDYGVRGFVDADDDPLSTFALDVDTGSYTVMRGWIESGVLPPTDSVRVEEYINAFDYDYDAPRSGLELSVDGGPSPFDGDNFLVRIGVQGAMVDDDERPEANLVFVVDTSGSMDREDRLGLVKESLTILVDSLDRDDTVAIVTYDDSAGVVLEPTRVRDADEIVDAIDSLRPGGSTNLEAGLETGYDMAREVFREGGVNRVVLASDGVANVGVTDPDRLARMIRDDADRGIQLVTVGFGMGNFNDIVMEQLADQGDGFYAYVDTDDEAERLFEDELTSTLVTVAIDAKIQVEFDDTVVEEYRLLGFENRGVLDSEFRNDDVDAGELGAGHQVTAIYEIELARGVDVDDRDEIGIISLRWEDPDDGDVLEIDADIDLRDIEPEWERAEDDFQLATVVATYAEVMRDSQFADRIDLDDLVAEADRLADELNDRTVDELADLIFAAQRLS